MSKATIAELGDLKRALALLTRLPSGTTDAERSAEAAWAWPVVGALIGLIQLGAALLLMQLGLTSWTAAGVAILVGVMATGALHEDGLADCADGFWGAHSVEQRLHVMRDSRLGTYGALALILFLGLKWSLITTILETFPTGFIVAAALSRFFMSATMLALPMARSDGLARGVGQPSLGTVALGGTIATLLCVATSGWLGAAALLFSGVACWIAALVARAKIGGQTGDVLGATQQIAELTALATLVTLIS